MYITRFFFFSIITFCNVASAQNILWEKSIGGKQSDYLMDAIPTADYGFILAGSSVSGKSGTKTSGNSGNIDFWIWKMDEHGNMDWEKSFGGSGRDLLYSVAHTADGGFILGGTSDSPAEKGIKSQECKGQEDYWILKLDAKGALEWERTLGGTGQDVLSKVLPLSGGGYLLCGSSSSNKNEEKSENSKGGKDFWIVRIDSKGKTIWERTLGGRYDDILRTAVTARDGAFILGGTTNSPPSADKSDDSQSDDFWLVKLDKSGNVVWEKTYGGDGTDDLTALVKTQDGNYIAGGSTNSSNAKNGSDVWLVKFDETGDAVWQQNYDLGIMDMLSSLIENKDGTFVAGINSKGVHPKKKKNEGVDDFVMVKFSEKGDNLWMRNFGSTGRDILRKAIITRDGGYLMAGMSNSVKASRDRNGPIGRTDFWAVKIQDENKKKEDKLPIEAFPNPAEAYTNVVIGYDYDKGKATLFDLAGRLIQEYSLNGDRTVPINVGSLPIGIYVVNVKTDIQEDGIKIIKK